MFPLGTVLLPGTYLPLHVFEERYHALVPDCLTADREFGVVLIERGSEVGGGDASTGVGTVARIVEAPRFDDGRWALGAVGARRVRVRAWLPDDPFPRAEVEDWPDPVPSPGLEGALDARHDPPAPGARPRLRARGGPSRRRRSNWPTTRWSPATGRGRLAARTRRPLLLLAALGADRPVRSLDDLLARRRWSWASAAPSNRPIPTTRLIG